MAFSRYNNRTSITYYTSLRLKLLLLVVLFAVAGNQLFPVIEAAVPPPPCLTDWSYLSHSHICVKLHAGGGALYKDTSRLCSTAAEDSQAGISPLLLGFQSVAVGDFHSLDTVVGNNIHQLWFHVAKSPPPLALLSTPISSTTSNISSCLAIRNRTVGESWSASRNITCPVSHQNHYNNATKLHFLCRMPSRTSPLALDTFENRQFSATSAYAGNDTFGLLRHEPHNIIVNTTFRLGVFQRAGWCSSTNSTYANSTGNSGESWEVGFDGRVLLSGLRLQYGVVGGDSDIENCRSWVSKFRVDYHNGNGWLPLASNLNNSNGSIDYDFSTGDNSSMSNDGYVDFWFSMLLEVERLRLKPIEGKRDCHGIKTAWSDRFCLRVGFFGYHFRRDLDVFLRRRRQKMNADDVVSVLYLFFQFTILYL